MLPEAKVYTAHPYIYSKTMQQMAAVLFHLDRHQEAYDTATELFAWTQERFGLEDNETLKAMTTYAIAFARLGRYDEAKAIFEDALTSHTRVLGRDHPDTQGTRDLMLSFGFAMPSSAYASNRDLMRSAGFAVPPSG